MSTNHPSRPAAFTLVEMLVVIVIIGILVGLLLPTIGAVRDRATNAAIAIEINNLAQGIEAYRLKYGDYPPDFSDNALVTRHVMQVWPNIDPTELDVLTAVSRFGVDPAEALVFWLGGFSSDPQHPFTGRGGPIRVDAGPRYSINPDRENGLYDFDKGRLTQAINVNGFLMSNEEARLRTGPTRAAQADVFPVYMVKRRNTPFVYIDARTYAGDATTGLLPASFPLAAFQPTTNVLGVATAYRSDRPRTVTPADPVPFEFANPHTFQIICAGLDDHFGLGGTLRRYPSGTNYLSPGPGDDDNITNFSEGNKLQDSKP